MTVPMTRAEVEAATQRAGEATEGPWEAARDPGIGWIGQSGGAWPCVVGDQEGSREDAAFIAHARTDVPALADTLEQAVELLRQMFARHWDENAAAFLAAYEGETP